MIKDIEKTHIFSKEEKLKNFGDGPWVDEPDLYIFEYQNIKCEIKRISATEVSGDIFGGYLCGYCHFPKNYIFEDRDDLDVDIHGGITFFEKDDENNAIIIGFDCTHSTDLNPSWEMFKKKYEFRDYVLDEKIYVGHSESIIQSIKKLMQRTYRDIDYVISECKSLVNQVKINNLKYDK